MKSALTLILLLARDVSGRITNTWWNHPQYGRLSAVPISDMVFHQYDESDQANSRHSRDSGLDVLSYVDKLGDKPDGYAYTNPSFLSDESSTYVLYPADSPTNDLHESGESADAFEARLAEMAARIAARTGSVLVSISPPSSIRRRS